jgi:hypothetical protein
LARRAFSRLGGSDCLFPSFGVGFESFLRSFFTTVGDPFWLGLFVLFEM